MTALQQSAVAIAALGMGLAGVVLAFVAVFILIRDEVTS